MTRAGDGGDSVPRPDQARPSQAEQQQRILVDRASRSGHVATPKPKAVPQRVMCKIKFANAWRIRIKRGDRREPKCNRATHAQHQFDKLISAIIDGSTKICGIVGALSSGREFPRGWAKFLIEKRDYNERSS